MEATQILFNQRVYIAWTNCVNIEVSHLVIVVNGLPEFKERSSALVFHKTMSVLSNMTFFGKDTFCALFVNDSSEISITNVHISEASSGSGSALFAANSTVNFCGCNNFINNTAIYRSSEGGAVTLYNCTSNFVGNILFLNNTATSAGAIFISYGNLTIFGNISFDNNRAIYGPGGAVGLEYSYVSISGVISFVNNSVNSNSGCGGALGIIGGEQRISGNIEFLNNSADQGGAMWGLRGDITILGNVSFIQNSAQTGGAISLFHHSIDISGNVIFNKNSAIISGGAISINDGRHTFSGNISFVKNTANIGGALELYTTGYDDINLLNLTGLLKFEHNSAQQGGAMAFNGRSPYTLLLSNRIQIEFIENQAYSTGGAIHFDESTISRIQCKDPYPSHSREMPVCFIELSSKTNIRLNFYENTAGDAGTVLYGGALDSCKLYTGGGVRDSDGKVVRGSYSYAPAKTIRRISSIFSSDKLTSDISSDPLKLCICKNDGKLDCDKDAVEIKTVPGREFTLKAVIVGQNKGIVPSSVRISLENDVELINVAQRIQKTGKECTELTYRLVSSVNNTNVTLFPDNSICRGIGKSRTIIRVNFLPCPDVFIPRGPKCVCEHRLQQFNVTCNVDHNSIERTSNLFWMGMVYENKTYVGLILHSGGCPFDFCIDTPVSITPDNIDVQCNHNHSGTLCGPCKENHSIALGTLHCLDCSNAYLALILPFALAGVVLVAVLLLLNLSVAVGTVNGLIFYANVVQANHSIFFPLGDTNILTVFIAWLNLDLGIETCFYDGMDAYAFTWLQFLFPLYVWILIGLIIIASRYSRKIAQSLGNNPVPTLATLFLLSYSKILRNIIAALSVTSLDYPDGTSELVWLYDGSVPYFQRADHIVLGIFAISVLLLLFLPYTLFLLLGQCLQAYSHHRVLSWINKNKPFMDAYHAPYKKETRYWTGLILLVRCILFLIFAVNSLQVGENHFDLLFTTTVTASLAGLAWIQNGVYEKVYNNILEASFILNLCIFSAATFHVKETGGNLAALAYTSVGIAFATFVLIFLYHVYLFLSKTSLWMKLIHFMKDNNYRPLSNLKSVNGNDGSSDGNGKSFNLKGATAPVNVPTTIVELCEPLLIHPESTPDYT